MAEVLLGEPVEPGLDRGVTQHGVGVTQDSEAGMADVVETGFLLSGPQEELDAAGNGLARANRASNTPEILIRADEGGSYITR
jgi:hypothetical protein